MKNWRLKSWDFFKKYRFANWIFNSFLILTLSFNIHKYIYFKAAFIFFNYVWLLYDIFLKCLLNLFVCYLSINTLVWVNNYITSVFHWNVTIWLVMKWSHDYKRDVSHPNETQIRTCTWLHDEVRCKQSMA
jgi:hypothetical protein